MSGFSGRESMRGEGESCCLCKEHLGNAAAITDGDGDIAVSYTCGVRGAMVGEEGAGINPHIVIKLQAVWRRGGYKFVWRREMYEIYHYPGAYNGLGFDTPALFFFSRSG